MSCPSITFVASRLAALPVANWSLKSVQVCRPENFCVQVWTAHEAGRAVRVAKAASRATQVCVWDCMYGEVESFIHFVCVKFNFFHNMSSLVLFNSNNDLVSIHVSWRPDVDSVPITMHLTLDSSSSLLVTQCLFVVTPH